jgi:hypothetical protein
MEVPFMENLDRYTRGRIRVADKEIWWRAPSRGVSHDVTQAYVYTYGEFQEIAKDIGTGSIIKFEPISDEEPG